MLNYSFILNNTASPKLKNLRFIFCAKIYKSFHSAPYIAWIIESKELLGA
jgi:hypothetical protein